MYSLDDLARTTERDEIWAFLKKNSTREKLFDLILDIAIKSQPAEADRLTHDSLRATVARIEFAKSLNERLPRSKEDIKEITVVTPEPVE